MYSANDRFVVGWDEMYREATGDLLWRDRPVAFVAAAVRWLKGAGTVLALELPCGDGKHSGLLASSIPRVVCVDSSMTALRLASARATRDELAQGLWCQSDGFMLPFVVRTFDAVVSWDLLGHLEDARGALVEMLRVCRTGGVIVANVFAIGDSTRIADEMVEVTTNQFIYRDRYFFRYYSESEVMTLVNGIDVDVVHIGLEKWREGPHHGYREYEHGHESWCFVVRKR